MQLTLDFFKLKSEVWSICMWPNMSVADFDLAVMICYWAKMDFFKVVKSG